MKKLIVTMMAVMFLITSVNICLADKGRDPPDPPASPPFEKGGYPSPKSVEDPPDPPVIPPSGGPPR